MTKFDYYHESTDVRSYVPADVKRKMIDFILVFSGEHGYSPTVRQIGAAVDIRSSSTTHKYLNELIAEGRLERDPRLSRTLRVVV